MNEGDDRELFSVRAARRRVPTEWAQGYVRSTPWIARYSLSRLEVLLEKVRENQSGVVDVVDVEKS